ncbi:MAG: DUF1259 domain-containing protein [Candidatus Eremiobacteraeota bacterium]|nr:DUF1259 domain-containing protein [Candidatus Eremiobacteraeota bacterium]
MVSFAAGNTAAHIVVNKERTLMANYSCDAPSTISRRRLITLGTAAAGGFAGAAIAGCTMPGGGLSGPTREGLDTASSTPLNGMQSFPADLQQEIEQIVQAKGAINYGLLQIEIDRNDITDVTLRGRPVYPSFEINGDLNFQWLGGDKVAMNSDLCLKRAEVDPFIDRLIQHNIIFQAEHQHFYDYEPIVFFIHFRAIGEARAVARGIKAALNATSTPFPQAPPQNPKTRLPAQQIGEIVGAKPSVGAKGVVSLQVPRAEQILLGGIRVNPYLNISLPIAFEPMPDGRTAAVSDFGMVPPEIQRLVGHMRARDWDIGCLYNQETDENPQLFFSHQFKAGDPIELARDIRSGLELLNVKLID